MSLEVQHRDSSFEKIRGLLEQDEVSGWNMIVEKYSRFVYTVAMKLIGHVDDKEEVAHEIYHKVFLRLRENNFKIVRAFKGKSDFQTYLFRIVQTIKSRVTRDIGREREQVDYEEFEREVSEAVSGDSGWSSIIDTGFIDRAKVKEAVSDSLGHLQPREMLMLKLRFQKGLKLREITSLMSFPDINKAAYELKKVLDKLDLIRQLGTKHGWGEEEFRVACDVFEEILFS